MEWNGPMFRYLALNDLDKEDLETFNAFAKTKNLESAKTYIDMVGHKKDHWLVYLFNNLALYKTTPLSFNDPFDCLTMIDPNVKDKDLLDRFRRDFWSQTLDFWDWKATRETIGLEGIHQYLNQSTVEFKEPCHKTEIIKIIQKTMKIFVDNSRTVCFSEIDNELLMWAHYAGKHEGYCLGFESSELRASDSLVEIYNVDYDNTSRPLINFNEEEEGPALLKKVFLSKSTHWRYEKEIRLLTIEKDEYYKFKPSALKRVVFGAEMSPEIKNGFLFLIETLNSDNRFSHIKFSKAELDSWQFKVNIA